jgi:DNA topoisomerase-1
MKPAVYDTQALALQASLHGKNLTFTARARALRYAGWMKLLPESDNEPEQDNEDARAAAGLPQNRQLPVLAPGQSIQASRGMAVACKTKPPSRYTEASLVKELESLGIGRPSTYATILKGLLDRHYLELQKRKLHATPLGMALYDVVQPCAFAETSYTANIEERLDQIAQRKDRFLALVSTVNQQLDSEIAALALQKRELPPDSTPPAATKTRKKKASNNKTDGTQTNPKNPRNMKNTNFSGGPYHDGNPCPVCKAGKIRYKTVQSGKNAGKPMYGCTDRNCRFFAWAAQAS